MSKKASYILAALIVIVCLGIGVMALAGGGSNDSKDSYGAECTYKTTQVDIYQYNIGSYTYTVTPSAGNTLIKVTGTLTNNQDKYTLSNNPYNFKLECNGLSYTVKADNYDSVDIAKGSSATFDMCFEIPNSYSDGDLKWDGVWVKVHMVKN